MASPRTDAPTVPALRRATPLRAYLRWLVVWSLLPMLVLALYLAWDSVAKVRAADDRASTRLSTEVASAIDQTLRERMSALTALSRSPLADDDSRLAEFHRAARSIRETYGNEVILADAEGRMLMHTGQPVGATLPPMPRPAGRSAAEEALLSRRPAVGDSFIGPIANRLLVAIAVPVLREARAGRVLVTIIETRQLQAILDRLQLPEGWSVSVLDGRRERLASVSNRAPDTAVPPAISASAAGGTALLVDDAGNARRYVQSPLSGWSVVLQQSADSRLAPLLHAAQALSLAIAGATLMGVLVGSSVSRRLARAVAALADGAAPADGREIAEIGDAHRRLAAATREREAATAALRDSEATFRALFDGLSDAALLTDRHRRILQVNPAFTRQFGWRADELLGQTTELLYADERDYRELGRTRYAAQPAEAEPKASATVYELRYRRRDGSTLWCESTSVRVQAADGSLIGMFGMHRDITQRMQTQLQLQQQHEQLERLVGERTAALEQANVDLQARAQTIADLYDRAPCGYYSVAPDGTVLSMNATGLAMLGQARERIEGHNLRELLTPDSSARLMAQLPGMLATGRLRNFEADFVRPDGSVLHTLVSSDLVRGADGQYVNSRSTMVDHSERKAHDAQIAEMQAELARRAELAESATRAKSAFLANMSHEIRTPMNAIIGLTHLMTRASRDAAQRERLHKVDTAARHLLQIINDILDLSKIEAGKMVLDDDEFSLDDLLSRALEMINATARAKGLELVLDTDHLPARMRGDPTRLAQALINLLSNAVKFTDHGWVRLRGQLLAEDGDRLHVRFEVQDTGPGIDEAARVLLFKPFEQADVSSTRRHGGTGLGLALTRHLARMMGGESGVDSQRGEGSTFWFTARLGHASTAAHPMTPVTLGGLQVLLVDDLPEARAALTERLEGLGIVVDAQPDGEAAVRQAQERLAAGRPHDLLMIDWRMSPMDGIETLAALRRALGSGVPPSILVTAFDEPLMWRQAREAHFDSVLLKPVTSSALHDALTAALGRADDAPAVQPFAPGRAEQLLHSRHAGQRLLLAEDNPVNREVGVELLRSVGFEVDVAENGERAVEMTSAGHYDLVLMDMHMPVLDGVKATRVLRERLGPALPIVAMTANAFNEDRDACLAAGMNDHVAKPVDPETLFTVLLRWLPVRGEAPRDAGAASASTGPTLLQRLDEVPGLDASLALRRVGGLPQTLQRVLQRFVDTYRHGEPGLVAGPHGDRQRQEACHSLRGACGAIAAYSLQQQMEALEQSEPDGEATHLERAREIDSALRQLVADISHALATDSA